MISCCTFYHEEFAAHLQLNKHQQAFDFLLLVPKWTLIFLKSLDLHRIIWFHLFGRPFFSLFSKWFLIRFYSGRGLLYFFLKILMFLLFLWDFCSFKFSVNGFFSGCIFWEFYFFFPFDLLLILFCALGFILFLSLIMIKKIHLFSFSYPFL